MSAESSSSASLVWGTSSPSGNVRNALMLTLPVLILLAIILKQQVNVWLALLCWPAGLVLTVVGTLGPGCLLAALNVKYRDFRYVIPFLVQALLFLTPVIYPISILNNPWLQYLLAMNPMYAAISIFRLPMMAVTPDPVLITVSLASGLIFLIAGLYYFSRTERFFADLS